jgi:hypothetical protein
LNVSPRPINFDVRPLCYRTASGSERIKDSTWKTLLIFLEALSSD